MNYTYQRTLTAGSKACKYTCSVFSRSNIGIVDSNPTLKIHVYVRQFSLISVLKNRLTRSPYSATTPI
jgi:hypothetical protein